MDGDVTLTPDTLPLLASALDQVPSAEAAGAMPATGRDRDAWRRRMVENGMLAGNCYALRGSFVKALREREVRMPVGLIGEDFFVSWLVASDLWRGKVPSDEGHVVFFTIELNFHSDPCHPGARLITEPIYAASGVTPCGDSAPNAASAADRSGFGRNARRRE